MNIIKIPNKIMFVQLLQAFHVDAAEALTSALKNKKNTEKELNWTIEEKLPTTEFRKDNQADEH